MPKAYRLTKQEEGETNVVINNLFNELSAPGAEDVLSLESCRRMRKEIRAAALTLGAGEARHLVEKYYDMQNNRIRDSGRHKSLEKRGEPHQVLGWLSDNSALLEQQVRSALNVYSKASMVGLWMRSIMGIGPVTTAGLLANLDVEFARQSSDTVGSWYRFAGLDPSVEWMPKTKRPWNARLKTVCYHVGEGFVKTTNRDGAFYGPLFQKQKAAYWERNLRGEFVADAEKKLAKAKKLDKDTTAFAFYSGKISPTTVRALLADGGVPQTLRRTEVGDEIAMLPPAHIHARARRWTIKLFLSHLHHMSYVFKHGVEPPRPFAFGILKHADAHYIPPPNMDVFIGAK